jgi:hypothetical protein
MTSKRKILIVGAGAVGQVYGWHLQNAGAHLAFFVKEGYANTAREGFFHYPLNRRKHRFKPLHFTGFAVHTTVGEVRSEKWDQVWLCISSAALRGDWLKPFLQAIGDATLICMTPGMQDLALLAPLHPPEKTLFGMIPFLSYPTPMPIPANFPSTRKRRWESRRTQPGLAYYYPPGGQTPLVGKPDLAKSVAILLRQGGCPAKFDPKGRLKSHFGSAILMPLVVSLEGAGWQFGPLKQDPLLVEGHAAMREALNVVSSHLGQKVPWWRSLIRPISLRLLLTMAPFAVPLDLELFFAMHFSKVRDQTILLMKTYEDLASEYALPSTHLKILTHQVLEKANPLADARLNHEG